MKKILICLLALLSSLTSLYASGNELFIAFKSKDTNDKIGIDSPVSGSKLSNYIKVGRELVKKLELNACYHYKEPDKGIRIGTINTAGSLTVFLKEPVIITKIEATVMSIEGNQPSLKINDVIHELEAGTELQTITYTYNDLSTETSEIKMANPTKNNQVVVSSLKITTASQSGPVMTYQIVGNPSGILESEYVVASISGQERIYMGAIDESGEGAAGLADATFADDDSAVSVSSDYALTLRRMDEQTFSLCTSEGKYLGSDDGKLVYSTEPAAWTISANDGETLLQPADSELSLRASADRFVLRLPTDADTAPVTLYGLSVEEPVFECNMSVALNDVVKVVPKDPTHTLSVRVTTATVPNQAPPMRVAPAWTVLEQGRTYEHTVTELPTVIEAQSTDARGNRSGIVRLDISDNGSVTAIDTITTETAADAVEYFSLQGIRILNPAAGTTVIRRQGSHTTKIRL